MTIVTIGHFSVTNLRGASLMVVPEEHVSCAASASSTFAQQGLTAFCHSMVYPYVMIKNVLNLEDITYYMLQFVSMK